MPAEFNAIYGDRPVFLAFGSNMIGYAAGDGGKERLAGLLQAKPKSAALGELHVNLKQLFEQIPYAGRESALKVLSDRDPGRVRLNLSTAEGLLRLQLSLSKGVLRAAVERMPIAVQFAPTVAP